MGKHFVRNHESTRNAQAIWSDYLTYMRTSSKADMQIEDLMMVLTSFRLTTTYRGTSQKFIVDWLDKIRQYEDLTPTSAHFPDVMKKAMLQNALNDIKAFVDVKVSEQMDIAKGRGPIPYDQYVTLVQNVAGTYDKAHSAANRQRSVNYHDYFEDENDTIPYDDDDLTFGSHATYDVNQHNNKGPRSGGHRPMRSPSLKRATWQSLSRDDQILWDKMSDAAKQSIIFNHSDTATDTKERTPHVRFQPVRRPIRDANIHETDVEDDTFVDASQDPEGDPQDTSILVNATKTGLPLCNGDIRTVLSSSAAKKKSSIRQANTHETITYCVSSHRGSTTGKRGALVDRGANGGLVGNDVRIMCTNDREVDVSGIDNHQMTNLRIVTAGGIVSTQRGEVLLVMHQYAHVPQGKTIHSAIQLESFGNKVDDRSLKLKQGSQTITTLDGYVIPLNFINGLPYMPIRPYTDTERATLPHVILTSDIEWDPSLSDQILTDDETWFDAVADHGDGYIFEPFDETGHYRNHSHTISVETNWHDMHEHLIVEEIDPAITVQANVLKPSSRNFGDYTNYFLQSSIDTIKRTFAATTQYARSGWITGHIYDTHKAPFPALNVH